MLLEENATEFMWVIEIAACCRGKRI